MRRRPSCRAKWRKCAGAGARRWRQRQRRTQAFPSRRVQSIFRLPRRVPGQRPLPRLTFSRRQAHVSRHVRHAAMSLSAYEQSSGMENARRGTRTEVEQLGHLAASRVPKRNFTGYLGVPRKHTAQSAAQPRWQADVPRHVRHGGGGSGGARGCSDSAGKMARRRKIVEEEMIDSGDDEEARMRWSVEEEEGLCLHRSEKTASGYMGVGKKNGRFLAKRHGGDKDGLPACMARRIEAAMAYAKHAAVEEASRRPTRLRLGGEGGGGLHALSRKSIE